jgi:pimeloyl-ACP methyl ester carboxylesterase
LVSADKEMNLDEWRSGGGFLKIDGLQIFHRREGSGPEPILCLHGFPTASFDYHKVWQPLSAQFDLVAFDMVGYGFSSKPRDWGYTTFDQVDVLQAVLRELDIPRVHILAHDYGNTITQELLARDAEGRLDLEIASICFLNGALFPETHRPIFAQKLLISPVGVLFGRLIPDGVFMKNLAKIFGPDTKPTRDELGAHLDLFKHNDGKRIAHRLIRYMTERARFRERWVPPLQQMKQPFRFINGLADPVSGEHLVRRFREVVPDRHDIIELDGIGHFPHLEAPEEIIRRYVEFREAIGRKT